MSASCLHPFSFLESGACWQTVRICRFFLNVEAKADTATAKTLSSRSKVTGGTTSCTLRQSFGWLRRTESWDHPLKNKISEVNWQIYAGRLAYGRLAWPETAWQTAMFHSKPTRDMQDLWCSKIWSKKMLSEQAFTGPSPSLKGPCGRVLRLRMCCQAGKHQMPRGCIKPIEKWWMER